MWVALVALLLASALAMVAGRRGAAGELSRGHPLGVRTSATLASEEAWEVGNRVAGPYVSLTGAGGVLATLGALAVTLVGASEPVVLAILLTITTLLLGGVVVGAVAGHRTARDVLASPRDAGAGTDVATDAATDASVHDD